MSSFTRIPNSIIDEARLNPYQYQLFSIIVRKTDGWCKVEDGISLSQFEKLVTFKKPKIISTLKELAELGLITKEKHYNEDKKQYSYSTYRISKRVVTENNKGSNSELQGVVTEDYKQKKLNTKETNTYNYTNSNCCTNDNKTNNISYDDFYLLWNNFANKNNLSKIAKLSDGRKKKILARLKDFKDFKVAFEVALKKANESSFLLNGSFFSFDWLIENDTNILKVIEDKYKDKTNSNSNQSKTKELEMI